MGTRLGAIQKLTTTRVRNVVREALRTGLDPEVVGDFLASVEWSGWDAADAKVKAMMGELEGWSTAYAEGALSQAQYVARLLSLLPNEKERRLIPGWRSSSVT